MNFNMVFYHSENSTAEGYPGYINVFSPKYIKFVLEGDNADMFETNYTANNVSLELMKDGKIQYIFEEEKAC